MVQKSYELSDSGSTFLACKGCSALIYQEQYHPSEPAVHVLHQQAGGYFQSSKIEQQSFKHSKQKLRATPGCK